MQKRWLSNELQAISAKFYSTHHYAGAICLGALTKLEAGEPEGAKVMLAREVAAAYANIQHLGTHYSLTLSQLQAQANTAFGSNDRDTILAFQAKLDGFNNLEGPNC